MDRQLSSIFLSCGAIVLLLLPLQRLTSDLPQLLLTLVLGIVFVYSGVRIYGRRMIGFVALGVIALQAQWGVAQFVAQRDLGMYLLGESRVSVERVAVAKFTAYDHKLIRAYGPYAHANSLGGVLVIGLIVCAVLARTHGGEHRYGNIFWSALILVLLLGVLVSFSRAAYLGTAIVLVSIGYSRVQLRWVPLIGSICIFLFLPLIVERISDAEDKGISARVSAWSVWRTIVPQQPWWRGVGVGKYTKALRQYFEEREIAFEPWELEPVHSVPLLMVAEWGWLLAGIAGTALLIWIGRVSFVITAIVPPLIFDHYFLTQVGPLIFLIVLIGFWSARHRVQLHQSLSQR